MAATAVAAMVATSLLVSTPRAEAVDTSSYPNEFVVLDDDLVLFSANSGQFGVELWATSGNSTRNSTWLVADVVPGSAGSFPRDLTVSGNFVYFQARDPEVGDGLWKTEAYEDTTSRAGSIPDDSFIGEIAPVGTDGDVVFTLTTPAEGRELWWYDRSTDTASIVQDLEPGAAGSGPFRLTPFGDRVLFSATDAVAGNEPRITDGMTISLVADVNPGAASSDPVHYSVIDDDTAVFSADTPAEDREPWVTDGTPGGTSLLLDIEGAGSSTPHAFAPYDGGLVFTATTAADGPEPWVTDGTPAGTAQLHDIEAGADGSGPDGYLEHDGWLYFDATTAAHGTELWRTDGSPGGAELVTDLAPGPDGSEPHLLGVVGGRVLFDADAPGHGVELHVTDGTAGGTLIAVESMPGPMGSRQRRSTGVAIVQGTVAVGGLRDGRGMEPWVTDGTPEGSRRLADLLAGIGPAGDEFDDGDLVLADDGRAFFAGTHPLYGRELWVSDGTPAGTHVIDVVPGPEWSDPRPVAALGDGMLFELTVGERRQLAFSDGTPGGTVQLTTQDNGGQGADPRQGVVLGDQYVFPAETEATGRELWVTDGTPGGTAMVQDIQPGDHGGEIRHLTVLGDTVYFRANDGASGRELWATKGTAATTVLAVDIVAGAGSSNPVNMAAAGGTLYFGATDGVNGHELWSSQGTPATTSMIMDIDPVGSSNPGSFTPFGGQVVFTAAGPNGLEPWITDGTPAGTQEIADLEPGLDGSSPGLYVSLGDRVVFSATVDGLGREPWVTDGVGVNLLRDVLPGPRSSSPRDLVAGDGVAWFTAYDPAENGRRIFTSDGTSAGTGSTGLPGWEPDHLVAGSLWYTAYTGAKGRGELFLASDPASGEATQLTSIPVVDRLEGPDRFGTAVAVSQDVHDSADTVMIARGDEYADALAGGPLAYHLGAPILLVRTGSLPEVTATEIDRLGATKAVVLGGPGAVSEDVVQALLDDTSVTSFERVAGVDRFATAVEVADELPDSTSAFVVEGINADPGRGWPDAVAVSSLASFTGHPILLTRADRLPDATAAGVAGLGITGVTIVGGEAAVSAAVAGALEDAGASLQPRLSGADRFATSLAVADASVDAGLWEGRTWSATALAFPDALVAGPAAAGRSAVLLLVHGQRPDPLEPSLGWFSLHRPLERAVLLGGEAAISAEVGANIADLAGS